jgi:fatty acid desaturase
MTLVSRPPPAGSRPTGPDRAVAVRAARQAVAAARLNRANGFWATVRGAGLLAVATPTASLAWTTGAWWALAAHWLVATVVLCTLPSMYHEATHSSLARNRWVNDAFGTLVATLHLVPFETWRYFHLTHHAHTGTDLDSEVYPRRWSRWTLLTFPLTQWVFVLILWRWTASTVLGRGPRWVRTQRQRRAVRVNAAFTLSGLAALAILSVVDMRVAGVVLVPCALSLMLASYTLVPEHFPAYGVGPGEPDQLDRTSSFASNPAVRLVMWNSNYHAAHHFAPRVPAHHLSRVDELIGGLQDPLWRWSGYWRWYTTRLTQLSWRPAEVPPLSHPPEEGRP